MINRILKPVYKILDIAMIVLSIILVGVICINIIGRRLGGSVVWVDEVSRLVFVWMSMIAVMIGYREGAHPSFTALKSKLEDNHIKHLILVINTLILVFFIYLLKGGVNYVQSSFGQKTSILGISVAWKYLSVPVTVAIMAIETLKNIILVWKK